MNDEYTRVFFFFYKRLHGRFVTGWRGGSLLLAPSGLFARVLDLLHDPS